MDLLQRLFKSVSGKTRIDILLLLLDKGEISVGEIANNLHRKITTISRNLAILEKDNFVRARHTSTHVFYSINDDVRYRYNQRILEILKLRLREIKKKQK